MKLELNKLKLKYWHECQYCSRQNSKKNYKIKLVNTKIEMENEVTENEIKNEIKVQTKCWHEC